MLMVDLATTIHVAYLSANGELKKYCISSTRSHGSIQHVTQKWPCDYDVSVQSFKDGGIAEKSSARGHLPRESYRKSEEIICKSRCSHLETLAECLEKVFPKKLTHSLTHCLSQSDKVRLLNSTIFQMIIIMHVNEYHKKLLQIKS